MGSLVLMMLANLGAGLVLLDKHNINTTGNTTEHVTIVDADNIIGLDQDTTIDSAITPKKHNMFSFIPVLSCIFITFGYACGLGPVPFILFGELFPSSVRGSATSITAFLRSITVFLSIKVSKSKTTD